MGRPLGSSCSFAVTSLLTDAHWKRSSRSYKILYRVQYGAKGNDSKVAVTVCGFSTSHPPLIDEIERALWNPTNLSSNSSSVFIIFLRYNRRPSGRGKSVSPENARCQWTRHGVQGKTGFRSLKRIQCCLLSMTAEKQHFYETILRNFKTGKRIFVQRTSVT